MIDAFVQTLLLRRRFKYEPLRVLLLYYTMAKTHGHRGPLTATSSTRIASALESCSSNNGPHVGMRAFKRPGRMHLDEIGAKWVDCAALSLWLRCHTRTRSQSLHRQRVLVLVCSSRMVADDVTLLDEGWWSMFHVCPVLGTRGAT